MTEYKDYQEELSKKNKPISKIANNIKPLHLIVIGFIIYIVNKIIQSDKNNTFIYLIVGGGLLIFLYVSSRGGEDNTQIPRGVAQKIALQDLQNEIAQDGSYSLDTKIVPSGYFRDHSIDTGEGMKLFKYNIGFSIKQPDLPKKDIIYQMSPFTGICKGIIDAPMGFTGSDIKDIQLVFPEVQSTNKKENT